MAYAAINASLKAKVAALLSSYSIQYDNDEMFQKPNDAVYLRAFVRYQPSAPKAFGDGVLYTLNGTLEFQVIGILGEDETEVDAAVDSIIAAFAYLKYNVGDPENSVVRCQEASPAPVGRVGGTYQVNVAIRFWSDLVSG